MSLLGHAIERWFARRQVGALWKRLPRDFSRETAVAYRVPLGAALSISIREEGEEPAATLRRSALLDWLGLDWRIYVLDPMPGALFDKPVAVAAFRGLGATPALMLSGFRPFWIDGAMWPPLDETRQYGAAILNHERVPRRGRLEPLYQAATKPLQRPFPGDDRPNPNPPGPTPPKPAGGAGAPAEEPCAETFLFYGLCFQFESKDPTNPGEPLWGEVKGVRDAFRARGYQVKDALAGDHAPDGGPANTFDQMLDGLERDLQTTTFCQCPGDQLVIYLAAHSEYPGSTGPFRSISIRYVTAENKAELVTHQRFLDGLARIAKIAGAAKKLYLIVESCRSGRLHEGGVFPPKLSGAHVLTATADSETFGLVNGFSWHVREALGRYGAVDWLHFIDLVKWGHAKSPPPSTHPSQPKNGDIGPCRVQVTLATVNYGGSDIGDDWKYDIDIDGTPTTIAEHNLAPAASEAPNLILYDRLWGACGATVSFKADIKATEVDPVTDDVGYAPSKTIKAVCTNDQNAIQIQAVVHEDSVTSNPAATLSFVLQVRTWCP